MTTSGRLPPQGAFNLQDAFAEEGCPVCRIVLGNVQRLIESTNYDALGDPGIRAELTEATGYCTVHAQQWLETAFVLGTATLYRDVIMRTIRELRGLGGRGAIGGRLKAVLEERAAGWNWRISARRNDPARPASCAGSRNRR